MIGVWGPGRVGYRVAPNFSMFSMSDSTPVETFSHLARELSALKLGYLHVMEPVGGPMATPLEARVAPALRRAFRGTLIANGGYDARTGAAAVQSGDADLVAFGVSFLANPDLPQRFRVGAPLNPPDFATFYAGEEKGYTDYPALAA